MQLLGLGAIGSGAGSTTDPDFDRTARKGTKVGKRRCDPGDSPAIAAPSVNSGQFRRSQDLDIVDAEFDFGPVAGRICLQRPAVGGNGEIVGPGPNPGSDGRLPALTRRQGDRRKLGHALAGEYLARCPSRGLPLDEYFHRFGPAPCPGWRLRPRARPSPGPGSNSPAVQRPGRPRLHPRCGPAARPLPR